MARLLEEVPEITGLTFRIHVEGGVSEGDYDFWREAFAGVDAAGRPVEIDMHAKGLDHETLDMARASGMPVAVSPKYLAEHMGLPYHHFGDPRTRVPAEGGRTNREKLSVGTPPFHTQQLRRLPAGRARLDTVLYRMWPGTQRVLTWGDPVFAAAYGRRPASATPTASN